MCLYFVFSLIYFLAYPDRSRYYSSLVLTFAFLATTKYIGQLFWTVSTAALLEANREWPLFPSAEDGICVGWGSFFFVFSFLFQRQSASEPEMIKERNCSDERYSFYGTSNSFFFVAFSKKFFFYLLPFLSWFFKVFLSQTLLHYF